MGHNTWIIRTCLSSLIFWTLLYKLKGEQCKFAYFHHLICRPNKFKIINMNIPIVKWTNPMTKEVFQDKVFPKNMIGRFSLVADLCLRSSAPTSWMPSPRTSLRGSSTLPTRQCTLRKYRFCMAKNNTVVLRLGGWIRMH